MFTENGVYRSKTEPAIIKRFFICNVPYSFPADCVVGDTYVAITDHNYKLMLQPEGARAEWLHIGAGEPTASDLIFLTRFANMHLEQRNRNGD